MTKYRNNISFGQILNLRPNLGVGQFLAYWALLGRGKKHQRDRFYVKIVFINSFNQFCVFEKEK